MFSKSASSVFTKARLSKAIFNKKSSSVGSPISYQKSKISSTSSINQDLFRAVYPVLPGELTAHLQLKTGQVFTGGSFGSNTASMGEAVFTTSLVGYPESMTDPSYKGQILIFTQPLIGNYGVPSRERDEFGLLKHFESEQIQCSGIVVSDYCTKYSHWNAVESLGEWCQRSGIPAITGVDTRSLVHLLRGQGSTLGALNTGNEKLDIGEEVQWFDPTSGNLVDQVSIKSPKVYNPNGSVNIGLIDCGVKNNIIRLLCKSNARVTLLPWDYDFVPLLDQFDGLFISNGPGSPSFCDTTVKNLQKTFEIYNRPIFGICMGNQLLGLAGGFNVYKLPYGNRGHNQPVIDLETSKCVITSQNHGFALDDSVVPDGWLRSFMNANDGSNEGIRHSTKPFYSVQFHPEAMGGPLDTMYMIRRFVNDVIAHKDVEWRASEAQLFDTQLGAEESNKLQMALQ
ncbi:Carbamoyl-phosphate synthase arginine-specific small chain [Smittium culicis]|uniref:Carbamoyl phosphate synthase arginine-specific small chain n=1 Tax=Smittium culicis TaxID=133412 RepID=A0A1R1XTR3_9FUNG|nr:Carbamoyl-phosphate synthase arginine-specific small chain [Smittium culicis]OMJ24356.1 Carbamoyl-phosphate synthase arginine-specific small chain [Smittium culicis]